MVRTRSVMAMAKTPSLKPSSERTLIRNEPPDGDETFRVSVSRLMATLGFAGGLVIGRPASVLAGFALLGAPLRATSRRGASTTPKRSCDQNVETRTSKVHAGPVRHHFEGARVWSGGEA
jgi:hypothetical protein